MSISTLRKYMQVKENRKTVAEYSWNNLDFTVLTISLFQASVFIDISPTKILGIIQRYL